MAPRIWQYTAVSVVAASLAFAACSGPATISDTPVATPSANPEAAQEPTRTPAATTAPPAPTSSPSSSAAGSGDASVAFDESKLLITGGSRFVALDDPEVLSASEAGYLSEDALIMGISQNGESRAYPVAMARYHHVINDVVGGQPVAVTY